MELFVVTYQGGGSVGKRGAPQIATIGKEQIWIYSSCIWSWRKRISFKLWKNKVLHMCWHKQAWSKELIKTCAWRLMKILLKI